MKLIAASLNLDLGEVRFSLLFWGIGPSALCPLWAWPLGSSFPGVWLCALPHMQLGAAGLSLSSLRFSFLYNTSTAAARRGGAVHKAAVAMRRQTATLFVLLLACVVHRKVRSSAACASIQRLTVGATNSSGQRRWRGGGGSSSSLGSCVIVYSRHCSAV